MGDSVVNKRSLSLGFIAALTLLATFAIAGWTFFKRNSVDTSNYDVVFGRPDGFEERPHSPQAIFVFEDAKEKLLIIGAVNRIMSDVNPTPELDTDGIAQFYVDRTKENMKNWIATKLDLVAAKGVDFRLIKRQMPHKTVVTAFGVKGNSTIMISMNANGEPQSRVDRNLDRFRAFLATLEIRPYMQPVYRPAEKQAKPKMAIGPYFKGQ